MRNRSSLCVALEKILKRYTIKLKVCIKMDNAVNAKISFSK